MSACEITEEDQWYFDLKRRSLLKTSECKQPVRRPPAVWFRREAISDSRTEEFPRLIRRWQTNRRVLRAPDVQLSLPRLLDTTVSRGLTCRNGRRSQFCLVSLKWTVRYYSPLPGS